MVDDTATPLSGSAEGSAPCIRNDVSFLPGKRPGVIEVKDWQRKRGFTLYDVEANVAQMLDGRRSCDEVARATARIGITTSTTSLHNFSRLLASFGLLCDTPASGQLPRGRRLWSESVRERYRDALLLSRTGHLDDAARLLRELLKEDASLAEAAVLLGHVDRWRRGRGRPDVNFAMLHDGSNPTPIPLPSILTQAPGARPSLPPLWTVSAVARDLPLPDVGDSILAYDPVPSGRKPGGR